MLAKVISGGQTGVDIAALRAAKVLGIPTGGWMPKGWKTLAGPRPEYAKLYGMRESLSRAYSARTAANVGDAHATLRIASRWDSPGELCTMRWLVSMGRPFRDVTLHPEHGVAPEVEAATVEWIRSFGDGLVLNVAGNSQETAWGIERAAGEMLWRVFGALTRP